MDDKDKIYADPTEPAVLRYGDTSVECPTLGEAVLEWHRLPAEKQARATIKVKGGVQRVRDKPPSCFKMKSRTKSATRYQNPFADCDVIRR